MWILWFVIGAGMGSVANALIDRLPRGESWVKGRSHCDKCGHVLGISDLIPLLSYVLLGGKCRYCHKKIPVRNFLVELVMAVGISYLGYLSGLSYLMGIFFVTVVIAVMDWETRLVSEWLVGLWLILVILANWGNWANWTGTVVGVGVIGGIWAISRGKAMGFGDVEIAAVMGWWLGWMGVAVALWVAFVSGAIIGVIKGIKGKKGLRGEIAFGPFLIFGSWMAYIWGERLWNLIF